MMSNSRLDDLLEEWEHRRAKGEHLSAKDLCNEDAQLQNELNSGIDALECLAWMDQDDEDDAADWQSPAGPFGTDPDSAEHNSLPDTTLSSTEFLRSLEERGLLKSGESDELQQSLAFAVDSGGAKSYAEQLVTDGRLTEYQAAVVLQRRSDPIVIDRYVILETIGRGGMGVVFKAVHKTMDRVVALKLLPPHAVNSAEKVERFQREARAAARLSHPNIVTVFDAAESNGIHFLAMEFVDGQDLSEVVRSNGPLSFHQAVSYIRDAALGMQHAHQLGIIHRDIKPANLLLASDGTVRVTDLGLAISCDSENSTDQSLTQNGVLLGTIAYLSPEQALESTATDERSDIYSLGATLYFLLTGQPPFDERSAMKTLIAHREQPVTPISQHRHDVPAELDRVCQRMLAKNSDDRYQTMNEVAEALAVIELPVEGEFVSIGRSVDRRGDTVPVATGKTTTTEGPVLPQPDGSGRGRWSGGNSAIGWFFGGAVFALLGIVITITNRDGSKTRIEVDDPKSVAIEVDGEQVKVFPDRTSGNAGAALPSWKPGHAEVPLPGIVTAPETKPGIRRWQMELWPDTWITSLSCHPASDVVACGTSHGEVRLLNAETLQSIATLPGHDQHVTCVAWSRDGVLASSSWDGTIRLWNEQGMQGAVLKGHSSAVNSVAWSPDGLWLVSAGEDGTF